MSYTVIPSSVAVDNVSIQNSSGVISVKDAGINTAKAVADTIAGTGSTFFSSASEDGRNKPLVWTKKSSLGTITSSSFAIALRIAWSYLAWGGTTKYKIYRKRNSVSVAVGTEFSTTDGGGGQWVPVSDDVSGWETGDEIELWALCDAGVTETTSINRTVKGSTAFSPTSDTVVA